VAVGIDFVISKFQHFVDITKQLHHLNQEDRDHLAAQRSESAGASVQAKKRSGGSMGSDWAERKRGSCGGVPGANGGLVGMGLFAHALTNPKVTQ
jgi:hypothetical protein